MVLGVVIAALVSPHLAQGIWESRLQRIVDLTGDVRGEGWGMDKERPAMIYLLENRQHALTGVGLGAGPFYFDHLITLDQFRGKYVDPNSGLLWGLYAFGAIGWGLLLLGLSTNFRGTKVTDEYVIPTTLVLRIILLYFLVFTPLTWLMVAIGFSCAPAIQRLSRAQMPVKRIARRPQHAT